jgi:hypothetical protein
MEENGPFRVSFRRVDMEDNETNFDVYEKKIRSDPIITPDEPEFRDEQTEDFVGRHSKYLYEYKTGSGHDFTGAYVEYLSS